MTNRSVSPLRVCPPTGATDFRQRIINLVAKHDPTKLQTLGVALQHFRGKEDRLLSSLVSRLGAEPTPQEVQSLSQSGTNNVSPPRSPASASLTPSNRAMLSPAQVQDLRRRIVNMYRKYNPARLGEVNTVLSAINGREDQALQMLIKKCGPEPTPEELTRLPPVPGTGTSSTPTPASRPLSPVPIRQRIMNMLIKYDRDKLSKMEQALETYRGREPQILKSLVQRYGPEPTPAEIAVLQRAQATTTGSNYDAYRTRVSNMLRRYNPAKLGTEDTILGMYKGKEEELLRSMVAKYGPEPSVLGTAPQSLQSSPGQSPITIHINPMGTPHQASLSQSPANPSLATPARQTLDVTSVNAYSETKVVETQQPCALNVAPRLFRSRVGDMYIKYAPEKLKELNHDVLSNTGREETFLRELVQRYGAEPTEQEILGMISTQGNFRSRVQKIYHCYLPSKLSEVEDVLNAHRGREAELIRNLLVSYGPEPSDAASCSPSSSPARPASLPFSVDDLETLCAANRSGSVSATPRDDYRNRLTYLYLQYCPSMVSGVDAMLDRVKGNEELLLRELVAKYGPEPSLAQRDQLKRYLVCAPAQSTKATNYKTTLTNYYKVHEPHNVSRVDDVLVQYAGREESLLRDMFIKYGPEPSVTEVEKAMQIFSSSSVTDASKYRSRVQRFYTKYDPSMLPSVDVVMMKYAGREDELITSLLARYGPEPVEVVQERPPQYATPCTSTVMVSSARQRLIHMFMRYDPDRLPCVESLLAQNVGSEEEMMRHLVSVYGPEPSVGDVAWRIFMQNGKGGACEQLGQGSKPVDLRTCMNNFCLQYDPSLLSMVESMFSKYTSQFEERVQSLFASQQSTSVTKDAVSCVSTTTENTHALYRRRVRNFFTKYDASRLGSEDDVIDAHAGREEEMIRNFVVRYGPEPTDAEIACLKMLSSDDVRRRIENMYLFYEPEKLVQMDSVLANFVGAEESLLRALIATYGPEPKCSELASLMSKNKKGCAVSTLSNSEYRNRLEALLQQYDPDRLGELDALLKQYSGTEDKLMRSMVLRYGPEPVKSTQVVTVQQQQQQHITTSVPYMIGNSSSPMPSVFQQHFDQLQAPVQSVPFTLSPTPYGTYKPTGVAEHSPAPQVASSAPVMQQVTQASSYSAQSTLTYVDYRTRVTNFLTKYDPENVPAVDGLLATYAGYEEYLMRELYLRYGPEPSSEEVAELLRNAWSTCQCNHEGVAECEKDYRSVLIDLYSRHEPERLQYVDQDLLEYAGREEQLLQWLCVIYEESGNFRAPRGIAVL